MLSPAARYLNKMVAIGVASHKAELEVAQAEQPTFEKVNWTRDRGLRKLYFWAAVLCVASATTGYDGYVRLVVFGKRPQH